MNVAVPRGEVLIGLGLLVDCLTRWAAFWGAFVMLTFWDVGRGYINGDFASMLVFLAVATLDAGRILGLGASIEQYEVGGRPLVERYPWTRYLLG